MTETEDTMEIEDALEEAIMEDDPTTPTLSEENSLPTVRCDGYCGRVTLEPATVDVVAGAITGEWDAPPATVEVTGVFKGKPVTEKWCVDCAEEEFDVSQSAHERRRDTVTRWVSGKTSVAFVSGVVSTAFLFVLFAL